MGARRVGLLAPPWICCDPAALHQLRKSPTLSQFYLYLTFWWYDILCKTRIVDTYANILVCLMSFCVHTQYLFAEKFLWHGNLEIVQFLHICRIFWFTKTPKNTSSNQYSFELLLANSGRFLAIFFLLCQKVHYVLIFWISKWCNMFHNSLINGTNVLYFIIRVLDGHQHVAIISRL